MSFAFSCDNKFDTLGFSSYLTDDWKCRLRLSPDVWEVVQMYECYATLHSHVPNLNSSHFTRTNQEKHEWFYFWSSKVYVKRNPQGNDRMSFSSFPGTEGVSSISPYETPFLLHSLQIDWIKNATDCLSCCWSNRLFMTHNQRLQHSMHFPLWLPCLETQSRISFLPSVSHFRFFSYRDRMIKFV